MRLALVGKKRPDRFIVYAIRTTFDDEVISIDDTVGIPLQPNPVRLPDHCREAGEGRVIPLQGMHTGIGQLHDRLCMADINANKDRQEKTAYPFHCRWVSKYNVRRADTATNSMPEG